MPHLSGPSRLPSAGLAVDSVVVLLHGVGADGSDLIDLATVFARKLPQTAFYAPDAPEACDVAPYGRQCFSLQDRNPDRLLAGLRATTPAVDEFLDALLVRHNLRANRMALVGFSQGTMTALHVAPRRPEQLACVIGYSGALVGDELLKRGRRSRPPVLLIHGDRDEVVPFVAMQYAKKALEAAAITTKTMARPQLGHAIDQEGLEAGATFLSAHLSSAATPPRECSG